MSELHIGLIALGIVAVLGVAAYNAWLAHRHRKLAKRLFNPAPDDVLLDRPAVVGEDLASPSLADDAPVRLAEGQERFVAPSGEEPLTAGRHEMAAQISAAPGEVSAERRQIACGERIEPVLRSADEAAPAGAAGRGPMLGRRLPAAARDEGSSPVFAEPDPSSVPPPLPPSMPSVSERGGMSDLLHLLSPSVDYIAALDTVAGVSAARLLATRREDFARLKKPVHWAGFDAEAGEWKILAADDQDVYRRICAGLQLADRQGAVGENDLIVFATLMRAIADELTAVIDLPEPRAALEAAAGLDAFCAGVDIQIGINVVASGLPFPGTKIRALAEAAGMLIGEEGRFVRADDDGNILYVMVNQEAAGFSAESMRTMSTHGLTFLLDVPTVAHGERVFNQIVDLAKRFADVLKGVPVDDNRRPLSEAALEPIRRQIAQYQASMAVRNLPAGGRLAKRLFS